MRLALSVDLGCYRVDADVEANLREAAGALAQAGCEIEEVELGWGPDFGIAFWSYWNVFCAAHFGHHLEAFREKMHPTVVDAIESGRKMSASDLIRAEYAYTDAWMKLSPVLERCDALLCPTESIPAPPTDYDEQGAVSVDEEGRFLCMDMTMQFNALKLPAISVPTGFSKEELPTGMQIIGRRYDDLTVLRLAAAFEKARPWMHRRPPL
jgi:amidase